MKNHYVSQFIIKRFSSSINIYDKTTKKIFEHKKPESIFYKKDIYSETVEKLMSDNIESKVAFILDNKILIDGDVILTREELYTLKQYMLICSVRTLDENQFSEIILGFSKNTDIYTSIYKELNKLPSFKDLNLSNKEIYDRTLEVFATKFDLISMAKNKLTTKEMIVWAIPFLKSYVAFWDAPNDSEFILTDNGMCTEYEGIHMITGGLSLSKDAYIYRQIKNKKIEYGPYVGINQIMYENYSFYNLNSHRLLVMINPFFKLYFNQKITGTFTYPIPDCWPAIIQDRELFDVPKVKYKIGETTFDNTDEFTYKPKVLSEENLIYLNSLILSYTQNIIGFHDPKKIINSIYYFIYQQSRYQLVHIDDKSKEEKEAILKKHIDESPLKRLYNYCLNHGGEVDIDSPSLFDKLISNIYQDFNEAPYICEYLLEFPERTINCKELDFLGKGVDRIFNLSKQFVAIKRNRKI